MTDIIERLRLDHKRMHEILKQLSALLDQDTFSDDRLYCLIDYLKEYPHEIHHPTEDLVFARALDKALTAPQRNTIAENAKEHGMLEQETEALITAVNADGGSAATLTRQINEYVEHQSLHMKREEREVFPLMIEVLDASDWEELKAAEKALHDPLFDAAESRFNTLFELLNPSGLNIGAGAVARFLSAT